MRPVVGLRGLQDDAAVRPRFPMRDPDYEPRSAPIGHPAFRR